MATSMTNLRESALTAPGGRRSIIDLLESDKVRKGMAAVATRYLAPDRMLKLAVNAVSRNQRLAECTPQSFLGALMASQALGLEPNTITQQAHLIPYARSVKDQRTGQWSKVLEVQFQVGYPGFLTLYQRVTDVVRIDAEAIRARDLFEHMQGSEAFLRFRKALRDRGELIGSFCLTIHEGAEERATILPLDEILKIRECSDTYVKLRDDIAKATNDRDRQRAQERFDATPWVRWDDVMAAKSAIKRHRTKLSYVDYTVAAAGAIDDQAEAGRTIDVMADPDVAGAVVRDGMPLPEPEPETSTEAFLPRETRQAQANEWPQLDGDTWVDSEGEAYDEDDHAWDQKANRPSVTGNGRFRRRPKTAAPAPKPQGEPEPQGGPGPAEPGDPGPVDYNQLFE